MTKKIEDYHFIRMRKENKELLERTKLMFKEQLRRDEYPFERILIFLGWGDENGNINKEEGDFKIFVSYLGKRYRDAGFQEDDISIRMWVIERDNLYPRDVVEL
jgi:hypothetical protein